MKLSKNCTSLYSAVFFLCFQFLVITRWSLFLRLSPLFGLSDVFLTVNWQLPMASRLNRPEKEWDKDTRLQLSSFITEDGRFICFPLKGWAERTERRLDLEFCMRTFSSSALSASQLFDLNWPAHREGRDKKKVARGIWCQTRAALQCTVELHNAQPLDSCCDSHNGTWNTGNYQHRLL